MKRTCIFLFFFLMACSTAQKNAPLNIMSFNIRYDNPADGPNAWIHRKEMVVETVKEGGVDIVGMQEVTKNQQQYLVANLPEYQTYGVGRDDGADEGEFCPVFFRKDRFELLEKSTFWLSENPDSIGSIGWDAHLSRIVSWVKLSDQKTNKTLYFFNTHFSHVANEARKNSALLILEKIEKIAGKHPVILSGDFNCTRESEPYQVITGNGQNPNRLFDTHFISATDHFGGLQSINGFGKRNAERIIDYLFCNSSFRVLKQGILTIQKEGVFVSDHYPIVATVRFSGN